MRTLGIAAVIDRTAKARFSIALRNLQSLKYQLNSPAATFVVAGGAGEDAARMFRTAINSAANTTWRWCETFYDARSASSTDGGTELTAAAAKRRDELGPTDWSTWFRSTRSAWPTASTTDSGTRSRVRSATAQG